MLTCHATEALCGVKCRLEYNKFEKKIVEGKGIIIEGWTYPVFTNPSNFKSVADIKELHDAIRDGTCKAVKLSQPEWNSRVASNAMRMAMGEDVYPDTLYMQKSSSLGKRKAVGFWSAGGGAWEVLGWRWEWRRG